jgi:predicted phosphodiesterase
MSKRNPLPFSLRNTEATVHEIPPSLTTGKLGLILSDQHFGRHSRGLGDLDPFLQEFRLLFSHIKPDYLLLLGDTLDWYCENPPAALQTLLENLEQFEIPVFLIGGNHDRSYIEAYTREHRQVTIVKQDLALGITTAGTNGPWNRIVFAHDLKNDFQVDPPDAGIFVWWMKEVFQAIVRPQELFFIGHTHQDIWDKKHRCGCVGRFAPAGGEFKWAVVTENNGFTLTYGKGRKYEEFARTLRPEPSSE